MEIMALGIVAIGALVFQQWLHSRLVRDLNTRLMAKSLEEFKYFTETYKKDIKRQNKILDKAIEEDEEVDVNAGNEATDKFLRNVEEDFDASEIDMEKLKKSLRGEDKDESNI